MIFIFIVLAIIFLIIGALVISHYENKSFVIKKYLIKDDYFDNCNIRIVFVSDLHDCKYGKDNKDLINAINNFEADAVIFGGDIFNGIVDAKNENAKHFLREVSKQNKCIYAMGNHEYRFFLYPEKYPNYKEDLLDLLDECGIEFLNNTCYSLDLGQKSVDIYGLSIDRKYYKRFENVHMTDSYVTDTLPRKNENAYNIVLAHNPKYFKSYSAFNPNLILSGHYHGGIMRLGKQGVISPTLTLFPKYSYGLNEYKESMMIVSGGLGIPYCNT